MSDRGRPLSLWGSWWNAIELLRPAFSRLSTFLWFATIVAGMTVRADMLGVTSIVRALNLRPALYHRLSLTFTAPASSSTGSPRCGHRWCCGCSVDGPAENVGKALYCYPSLKDHPFASMQKL